jgi:hypothetical protein
VNLEQLARERLNRATVNEPREGAVYEGLDRILARRCGISPATVAHEPSVPQGADLSER